MFAIETFVNAVAANQLDRAVLHAQVMTEPTKAVAREIWKRWVGEVAPF